MTRTQANVLLAALLETLAETGGSPAGVLYTALMSRVSLAEFETLMSIMVDGGLAGRAPSHMVTLTAKGRDMAKKVAEMRQSTTAGA